MAGSHSDDRTAVNPALGQDNNHGDYRPTQKPTRIVSASCQGPVSGYETDIAHTPQAFPDSTCQSLRIGWSHVHVWLVAYTKHVPFPR